MAEGKTLADYGITNTYTKDEVNALIPVFPTLVSAFINDVGYLTKHQDLSGKQDKLNNAQLNAANSGITAAKVTTYNSILSQQTAIINKADKATTLAGYGIVDTYTKTDVEQMFENLKGIIDDALND